MGISAAIAPASSILPQLHGSFLSPFCQQLIGQGHCWTSTTLATLAALPVQHQQQQQQMAEAALQVLLLAAAQLEGAAFLTTSERGPQL